MRMNDVIVNANPLSTLIRSNHYPELRLTDHSIVTSNPTLHIPLYLRGVMSYFEKRKPTITEIEDSITYPHIVMTYDMPQWDPYDPSLEDVEYKLCVNLDNPLFDPGPGHRTIPAVFAHLACISSIFDDDFVTSVVRSVRVSSAATSVHQKGTVTAADLARR
jgi:hypothetical protein